MMGNVERLIILECHGRSTQNGLQDKNISKAETNCIVVTRIHTIVGQQLQ